MWQAMRDKLDFRNEILTLSMIEHLNLVRLYGYLEQGDEQIILVEYVSNGTLREHLDGKSSNNCFTRIKESRNVCAECGNCP